MNPKAETPNLPVKESQLPPPASQSEAAERDRLIEWAQECFATLQRFRLEEETEAIEKSGLTIFDPDIRLKITDPNVVKFRRSDDQSNLTEAFEDAKKAIPTLNSLLNQRSPTLALLHEWGAFQYYYGIVMASYFARGDDLGPIRAGMKGGEAVSTEAQKRWIAHLIVRRLDEGRDRSRAERDVAAAIVNLLRGPLPSGFPREWFEKILTNDRQLKSTYSKKHLSNERVRSLAREPSADLPDVNIDFPSSSTARKTPKT